jgi:hypothetical protein
MLSQVDRRPITPRLLTHIRGGSARRRYQAVLECYECYRRLIGTLNRSAIRHSVEQHGLATRDDPTLFELDCTFRILDGLAALGWMLGRLGLFEGALKLNGRRDSEALEVAYQHTPRALSRDSIYRTIQQSHELTAGGLRPDLVLRYSSSRRGERWLVVEVKGGHRSVQKSARAAAYDLLAYATAYETVLTASDHPYGLGIAWGEGLEPAVNEPIMLCTPDALPQALASFASHE